MSRRLTFLFAVAAGAAIANLYWAQPPLGFIAGNLHAANTTAGWLVTATQVGYAVGVLRVKARPVAGALYQRQMRMPTRASAQSQVRAARRVFHRCA